MHTSAEAYPSQGHLSNGRHSSSSAAAHRRRWA